MKRKRNFVPIRAGGPLLIGAGIALLVAACAGETVPPLSPDDGIAGPANPQQNAAPPPSTSIPQTAPESESVAPPQLESSTFVEDNTEYNIAPLLLRDAILPIYNPEFVTANEANYLADELVIGVEIDGEEKAYPITLLNQREMVNDELGGTPILVTW